MCIPNCFRIHEGVAQTWQTPLQKDGRLSEKSWFYYRVWSISQEMQCLKYFHTKEVFFLNVIVSKLMGLKYLILFVFVWQCKFPKSIAAVRTILFFKIQIFVTVLKQPCGLRCPKETSGLGIKLFYRLQWELQLRKILET